MIKEEHHPWPARLMHWIHLICMVLLIISGFYIHRPFAPGWMGLMRTVHFFAMYAIGLNLIVRIYWALFGVKGDIKHFLPEKGNKGKLLPIALYYLFLKKFHPRTAKYNPLQKITYNFWVFLLLFQGLTGMALYWPQLSLFSSLNYLVGGLMTMRMIHYLVMWVFIITVAIHVYLSLAEDIGQFFYMFFGKEVSKSH